MPIKVQPEMRGVACHHRKILLLIASMEPKAKPEPISEREPIIKYSLGELLIRIYEDLELPSRNR